MNYEKHYNLLIERAKNRLLEGYTERHHIIPRCLGGSNEKENLARLTPEEHYVAHLLLVKMNPGNHKLVYAAIMMTTCGKGQKRNNKQYAWLKRKHGAEVTKNLKGKTYEEIQGFEAAQKRREKQSKAQKGRITKESTKEILRQINLGKVGLVGKKNPMYGIIMTNEQKEKRLVWRKDPEKVKATSEKISKAHAGKKHSKERRENISKGMKGKVFSKEHRENISKSKKGKPNLKAQGRVVDAEGRKRMSISKKGKFYIKTTDQTKYQWIHELYGKEYCSRYDLKSKYPDLKIDTYELKKVIKKDYKSHRGWKQFN